MTWYYEQDGISHGPESEADLLTYLKDGSLQAESLIWHPGLDEWQTVLQLRPEWLTPPKPVAAPPPGKKPGKPVSRATQQPLTPSLRDDEPKKPWWKKLVGG
jgi:GYF domain 2